MCDTTERKSIMDGVLMTVVNDPSQRVQDGSLTAPYR